MCPKGLTWPGPLENLTNQTRRYLRNPPEPTGCHAHFNGESTPEASVIVPALISGVLGLGKFQKDRLLGAIFFGVGINIFLMVVTNIYTYNHTHTHIYIYIYFFSRLWGLKMKQLCYFTCDSFYFHLFLVMRIMRWKSGSKNKVNCTRMPRVYQDAP